MRLVGVIDLRGGRAVHARGGQRADYLPIGDGDAVALARRYAALGVRELYVADLDAIQGGITRHAVVASICDVGVPVWLDAGISSRDLARDTVKAGAARVVVGLETLTSIEALTGICAEVGGEHVAFSLDLRDGTPIGTVAAGELPERIAARAAGAGAGTLIVLDLGRVGADAGMDVELMARVRAAVPDRILLAGGGVRGLDDLEQLANAGCDGALVATALHAGRMSAAEIQAAHHFSVRR